MQVTSLERPRSAASYTQVDAPALLLISYLLLAAACTDESPQFSQQLSMERVKERRQVGRLCCKEWRGPGGHDQGEKSRQHPFSSKRPSKPCGPHSGRSFAEQPYVLQEVPMDVSLPFAVLAMQVSVGPIFQGVPVLENKLHTLLRSTGYSPTTACAM